MTRWTEARALAFCQELVRLEGFSGEEPAAADAVEREMCVLGYDEVRRGGLGSVGGVIRGARPAGPDAAGGALLFDAHLDVVPVTEPAAWRFPPFSGERAKGSIRGRGATDVKGSLAALVVALGTLPRGEIAGTLLVSASVGEEHIEGLAVGHVLAAHPVRAAIICEPTELRLGLGHRGRASLVVEAAGRGAHTSRAENGINAVYRLTEAIARIRAMTPRADALLGRGHIELVEVASRPFPGSAMVPYHAIARFDRRLVRGETRESVLAEMDEALVGLEGLSARLEIPTLVYGAGDINAAHAVDESVSVEELERAVRGYQALARGLAGSDAQIPRQRLVTSDHPTGGHTAPARSIHAPPAASQRATGFLVRFRLTAFRARTSSARGTCSSGLPSCSGSAESGRRAPRRRRTRAAPRGADGGALRAPGTGMV